MIRLHCFYCFVSSVLHGLGLESEHSLFENHDGTVTLIPLNESQCSVNGVHITEPCQLNQGQLVALTRFLCQAGRQSIGM